MKLNNHLNIFLNSLNNESVKELNNICHFKLINNINIKKLKYTAILYNSLYPCINTIHFIKNISKYNYDISYLKKILDNPLLHPVYENSIKSYSYYLKNKKNNVYESKIFWNNFFLKNDANTPIIKAIIINGNLITNYSRILKMLEHNKNEPKKILNIILQNNHDNGDDIINKDIKKYDAMFINCIIKPNYGCRGIGIKTYINNDSIPTKEGVFLIQEMVKNINYNGHFRIITHWNKENNVYNNLYTYLFIQEDKTKIQSNAHAGATLYEIKNDNVRKITEKNYNILLKDFNYSHLLLKMSIMKAIELHKKLDAIIIGWDVKLTDENYYFLEGNFGPGNVFFHDYYYLDKLDFASKIKYD